jgi:hypothetical protein
MDCVTILAHAAEPASEAVVPIDVFWDYIISLRWLEAMTFISFGAVCLMYGWRVFKVLVVISFSLLGLGLGMIIGGKIVGESSQLWGGAIGMVLMALISIPLMQYAVSILGAMAGGMLTAGLWYACGLNERYIWAGALIGVIAGGMISFIVFRIAVMLFSSLGGSSLMVVGLLALLYRFPQTEEQVQRLVFEQKWFLPVALIVPTVIGLIVQNKCIKGAKEWEV